MYVIFWRNSLDGSVTCNWYETKAKKENALFWLKMINAEIIYA